MKRKLETGEAIDVSNFPRTPEGDYILPDYADGIDYCDAAREAWIWSIGQHLDTAAIHASTSAKFYQNPAYECLWLR